MQQNDADHNLCIRLLIYACISRHWPQSQRWGIFEVADDIADPPGAAERGHGGRTTVFGCSPDPEHALLSRRAAAWQQAANSFECKQPNQHPAPPCRSACCWPRCGCRSAKARNSSNYGRNSPDLQPIACCTSRYCPS